MKKIMVAVDGSESSEKAAKEAAKLADSLKAQVIVSTVIKDIRVPSSSPDAQSSASTQSAQPQQEADPGVIKGEDASFSTQQTSPQSSAPSPGIVKKRQKKQELEDKGNNLLDKTESLMKDEVENLEVEKKLLKGNVEERICDFASNENIDLIVVGNRGEGGLKRFLLGSTSEKVVRHAETSVLVVK
ncbi:MAG: universal stress protein [Halanaerobiales bacterium]